MSKAIEINNLGKQYRRRELGGSRYQTLRDALWSKGGRKTDKSSDYFWALRNVDLSIEQGSIVGVIGPNGAGKSTLLKLLSRVTSPTEGSFTLRGRVASLLEVGTGFHPELTGRENIFLSGAVMGMRRTEIQRRFDEIVTFSGVEDFLDLPVKRYSSGMYVRLGFAIAAHLEAEILLVDEVLAVGDAEFQKKCLGKIGDVAQGGRTVLFVSHNLNSIQQLCTGAVIVTEGKLEAVTTIQEGVEKYLNSIEGKSQEAKVYFNIRKFSNTISLNGSDPVSLNLVIGLQNLCLDGDIFLGFVFRNLQGISVFGVNNEHYYQSLYNRNRKSGVIVIEIPTLPLISGRYILDLYFNDKKNDLKETWYNAACIDVPTIDGVNFSLINSRINQVVITELKWIFL